MRTHYVARGCVLAFVGLVCFWRLGSTPLYETDEGFTANRADSFERHGTWILSYDDVADDDPQFRKPPLLYWCVAALYKAIGRNMWAVRLPTAASAFLSCLLLYLIARRYVGEGAALLGALFPCAVPFFVDHIRTAMLDVPLIFFFLFSTWAFLFLPQRWYRPVLVGLSGGLAFLLKGPASLTAVLLPLLFGLIHHRFRPRVLAELAIALLVSAALPLAYFAMIPGEYKPEFVRAFVFKDVQDRVRLLGKSWERMRVWYFPLFQTLRWHVPAAAIGFILMVSSFRREPRRLEWPAFFLLTALPILYTVSGMLHPYSRYLLPLYPFLLSFSAFFIWEVVERRRAAWWLVPFAVASWFVGDSVLRWTPVAAALIVFAKMRIRRCETGPGGRLALRLLFAAAIVVPSYLSDEAHALQPFGHQQPRPELIPLSEKAAELVPENEKLLLGSRFTCHTILFHSRRSLDGWERWLLSEVEPGETRYGIFRRNELRNIPNVETQNIATNGAWLLMRIDTASGKTPWKGFLVANKNQDVYGRTLEMLNAKYSIAKKGLVITQVPDYKELTVPLEGVRIEGPTGEDVAAAWASGLRFYKLAAGASLTFRFPEPIRCCGLELVPLSKQEQLGGFAIECREPKSGRWRTVKAVQGRFSPTYKVSEGRVVRTSIHALRARFDPVQTAEIRFKRVAEGGLRISGATVWAVGEK